MIFYASYLQTLWVNGFYGDNLRGDQWHHFFLQHHFHPEDHVDLDNPKQNNAKHCIWYYKWTKYFTYNTLTPFYIGPLLTGRNAITTVGSRYLVKVGSLAQSKNNFGFQNIPLLRSFESTCQMTVGMNQFIGVFMTNDYV